MPLVRVPDFLPSTSGFHFPNAFPPAPALRMGPLKIGNAADGLCGGMAFAALDLRAAGRTPPPDTQPPGPDSPWFHYFVSRLLRSWGLPWGGVRYLWWMALPDRDLGPLRGVAHRTRGRWPAMRAELDAGAAGRPRRDPGPELEPVPGRPQPPDGGLRVRRGSGRGVGTGARLRPQPSDDDGLAISLPLAGDPGRAPLGYIAGESPVRAFFATRYRPRTPPPDVAGTGHP